MPLCCVNTQSKPSRPASTLRPHPTRQQLTVLPPSSPRSYLLCPVACAAAAAVLVPAAAAPVPVPATAALVVVVVVAVAAAAVVNAGQLLDDLGYGALQRTDPLNHLSL